MPGVAALSIFGRPICPSLCASTSLAMKWKVCVSLTRPPNARCAKCSSVEIGPGSEALSKYGPVALATAWHSGRPAQCAAQTCDASAERSPSKTPTCSWPCAKRCASKSTICAQGQSFHGIEWYLPYFYEQPATLLDYLPERRHACSWMTPSTSLPRCMNWKPRPTASPTNCNAAANCRATLPAAILPPTNCAPRLIERQADHAWAMAISTAKATDANTPLARCLHSRPALCRQDQADRQRHRQAARGRGRRAVFITRQAARLQATLAEADIIAHVQSDLPQPPPPTQRSCSSRGRARRVYHARLDGGLQTAGDSRAARSPA